MMDLGEWVAIGVGVATATGIIISIRQSNKTLARDYEKQIFETLQNLEKELMEIKHRELEFDEERDQLTKKEKGRVTRYASDYLNILERIAFLGIEKYANEKVMEFYAPEFSYGLRLKKWKEDNGLIHGAIKTNKPTDAENKEDQVYPYLQKICENLDVDETRDKSSFPGWLETYSKS